MTVVFVSARLAVCKDGSLGILVECEGEKILYESLCRDRDRVEELVRRINGGEVSRHHIDDVIDDFLG